MPAICIIPARGGSKRIPKKNIKKFLGKPVIAYSIEAAIQSNLFDEVMVSTDDKEIADVAINYGAKVPFLRSQKNSDDFATTYDVMEEVLNEYKNKGKTFEICCCLYSCAPFVTASKLKDALDQLIKDKLDTIYPIVDFNFPIQRAVKLQNGKIEMFDQKYKDARSQDLEKAYHDTGQFYWFNTEAILEKGTLLTDNIGGVVVSEMECQDIDTPEDWKLAELKFELMDS